MKKLFLMIVALMTTALSYGQGEELPETKHITKEEFLEKVYDYEKNPDKWVFKGKRSCIFVFHASWCGPCRQTMPVVQMISFDYSDRVDIYQINVDMQPDLARHFKLEHIPTIYFAPKDGSEPKVWVRVPTYEQMSKEIEDNLL